MPEHSVQIEAFVDIAKLQRDLTRIRLTLSYMNRWWFFRCRPITKLIIWATTWMISFTVKRHTHGRR